MTLRSRSLLASIVALASCAAVTPAPAAVPDELPLRGGGSVALAGLRGSVVLVDFFASWCEPCRTSMPFYAALVAGHPGLRILAVSVDEDAQALETFLDRVGRLPFPVALDPQGALAASWAVDRMPTCVILDAQGREVFRHGGFDEDAVRDAVERALGAAR